MQKLRAELEKLAATLVMADSDDANAAAAIAGTLRQFAELTAASQPSLPPICTDSLRAAATHLEQSHNPGAWELVGQLLTALQMIIRDGRALSEVKFPDCPADATVAADTADTAAPAAVTAPAAVLSQRDLGGKYLTFKLMAEEYGLEILRVQEIIKLVAITRVPGMPPYLRGVINLRGKVIPVTDLRLKFDMPAAEADELTCIVVVQIPHETATVTLGLIVDEVLEVNEIKGEQIDPAPELATTLDNTFILGVAKMAERVIMLLNTASVLPEMKGY